MDNINFDTSKTICIRIKKQSSHHKCKIPNTIIVFNLKDVEYTFTAKLKQNALGKRRFLSTKKNI